MTRKEFFKEFESLQALHGCNMGIDIEESYSMVGRKVKVNRLKVTWCETDNGEWVDVYGDYDSYRELIADLSEKICERRRNIFDANLYETIAEYMVENSFATFDRKVGRYQVVVELDSRFYCYGDGCADIEDGWSEVETNFDSDRLEAAIEKAVERRDDQDAVRYETEQSLRRIA